MRWAKAVAKTSAADSASIAIPLQKRRQQLHLRASHSQPDLHAASAINLSSAASPTSELLYTAEKGMALARTGVRAGRIPYAAGGTQSAANAASSFKPAYASASFPPML